MKTLTPLVVATVLSAACTVGPDYQRPPLQSPEQFRGPTASPTSQSGATASLADEAWWQVIHDQTLQGLIAEALRNAHDVRLAAARVEEARANAGITSSLYYPVVAGTAGWSRGKPSELVVPGAETLELYDVNLGLAWEIDLWGRIRRLNEGALAQYLATEEARRGVQLSLVSDVATTYFELRTLDSQLEIARRTSEAFAGTHDLFSRRLEAGLASSLETSSAAASLATTNAAIPELERRIAERENSLSFLLGRKPAEVPRGVALDAQVLPPEVPAGLPSDLLERRPDLREAERELMAANAEVGVAVADYFPRLSLTAAFGGVAPQVSELFGDGKAWSVGGGLLSPIFQGDRLRSQHRASLARWEQAKVRYEQTVTGAFAEVSTALVAYSKLAEVERELTRSVDAHRDAVQLASSRYLSGLADYLEVLQAQQELFPAENALARTRFERFATLVELYRALGGGWRLPETEWAVPDGEVASRSRSSRTERATGQP